MEFFTLEVKRSCRLSQKPIIGALLRGFYGRIGRAIDSESKSLHKLNEERTSWDEDGTSTVPRTYWAPTCEANYRITSKTELKATYHDSNRLRIRITKNNSKGPHVATSGLPP